MEALYQLNSSKLGKTDNHESYFIDALKLLYTGRPKKKRAPTPIKPRFLVFCPNEMKLWS